MRLFTGIALAPNVVDKLSTALSTLRQKAQINWSPVENLHITCKFIGAWPDDRLSEITSALRTVAVHAPIPITISPFGFFPNPRRPRLFLAGVQSAPALAELAAAIDRTLSPLGIAPETRAYRPHVTLARVKPAHNIRALREHIAAMTDFDFGSFDALDFHLYSSSPAAKGSVYTKLATYDLMRENRTTS
jgi:2'-5' RNA ligase